MKKQNIQFGAALRELRHEAELTQREVADGARCSETYVCQIETGRKGVSYDKLKAFATAFGVPRDYFVMMAVDSSTIEDEKCAQLVDEIKTLIKLNIKMSVTETNTLPVA